MRKQLSRVLVPWRRACGSYDFWRVKPSVTRLLGPQFRRNRHRIGIALTYGCNLRCYNCDESSAQAPADTQMTVEQIQRFVDESTAANYRWDRIEIAGGEPTRHSDFLRILDILREYRDRHSPHMVLIVLTNGDGENVQRTISQIPSDVVVINSQKGGKRQGELQHTSFNVAPDDVAEYKDVDFRNACEWTDKCGTGLGPSGYYHCPVAAGMDRIFGWDIGRKALPSMDDDMNDLADRFCRNCGHFLRQLEHKKVLDKPLMSPIWRRAYADYRTRRREARGSLHGVPSTTETAAEEMGVVAPE